MDMRKIACVIVLVIFLCALATGGSEGRTRRDDIDSFLSNIASPPQIDEDTSEQIWIYCRLDLVHMKENFEDFNMYLQEEMGPEPKSVIKRNLQKAISIMPAQMKQTLLDCLQRQKSASHISGEEDDSKDWYVNLESLFRWPDASRRDLGEKLIEDPTLAPVPAPTPAPASVPTPAPSPGPRLGVYSPTYAPEPSPSPSPTNTHNGNHQHPAMAPRKPFFPPDSDSGERPPGGKHSSSDFIPHPQSEKHQNDISVAIAVAVTAAGASVLALLLFCCYWKCRSNTYSGYVQKDDSPLLNLSFGDISVGSPGKSNLGDQISKEKIGNLSFGKKPSQNGNASPFASKLSVESDIHNSSLEVSSLGEVAAAAKPLAEPSAASGNVNAPSTPFPPLKLPPGRANPSLGKPNPSSPESVNLSIAGAANPSTPGTSKPSQPGPPPPPPPSAPRPPPPPKGVLLPPRPPPSLSTNPPRPSPLGLNLSGSAAPEGSSEAPKTKLKPFFWDKVLANPDQSMVWHDISAGSFQFDEEMIEDLFGYANADKKKNKGKKGSSSQDPFPQYIQIIDSKKAQNLSILLRALNVTTEEVCDALHEGNELPIELLQTLLKMAPSAEEELKLRLYSGEISHLGHAERFLKILVDIPFAFKRMDSLLFMNSLQEEISGVKESLATLEVACKELRNSRLFLKLLEAVLKTGNRMNDGTFRGGAQAFRLDTLLKLADVKGTDGKTTLLHFVVQEIIRSEGIRAARAARESQSFSSVKSEDLSEDCSVDTEDHYGSLGLQVVSGLGAELENVRKAAVLDTDGITSTVSKLGHALVRSKDFLNSEMKDIEEDKGFRRSLESFVGHAEGSITWLLQEETKIMALVKSTADYFHGKAGKDEGLRLFVIVRDFLIMLDKTCKEVRESRKLASKTPRNIETQTLPPPSDHPQTPSTDSRQSNLQDLHRRLFPAIMERRIDDSSSDDDSV